MNQTYSVINGGWLHGEVHPLGSFIRKKSTNKQQIQVNHLGTASMAVPEVDPYIVLSQPKFLKQPAMLLDKISHNETTKELLPGPSKERVANGS